MNKWTVPMMRWFCRPPLLGCVALFIALGVCAPPLCGDVVELRGSAPKLEGDIVSVSPAGIVVRTQRGGLEQQQSVAWSDVRDLRGAAVPKEAARWITAGEALWRGRMRVARGDWMFALDPLQRAFRAWDGAAPSADGLAAAALCAEALRRAGRAEESLKASFEAIRLARAGVVAGDSTDALIQDAQGRAFDTRMPVPPALAPGAFDVPAAIRARAVLANFDAVGDVGLAAVVAAYAAALEVSPGDSTLEEQANTKIDAAAKATTTALEAIRDTRSVDPKRRSAALATLARVRRTLPQWFEPWARFATGAALASDSDQTVHDRGLVLLSSLIACDSVRQPLLAAQAAVLLQQRAQRAADASSIAAFITAPQSRPDSAVPKDMSDATSAWLESRGSTDLVVAHLEAQLDSEPEGEGRATLVSRLASIMAARLEREDDEARRNALMARAMSLVKRFDIGSEPLRLVILRAQHRAAQRTAEDRRAGRGTDAECEAARQQFESLIKEFAVLAGRSERAKTATSRDASTQVGIAAEQLAARATREEEIARNAQFFRAWAGYYSAWLARELGHPDWRERGQDSMGWFANLIEPGKAAIDPSDVSVDLRSNEGFASSILGSALAASLVQTGATADAWFVLLASPGTHGSVRLKLLAWRMASYLDRGDFATALSFLQSDGDGSQGVAMSLIAAARAGRQPDAPAAAELLTEAVGRLVAAGKLRELSLISLAPGAEEAGSGAKLFAAVRAAAEANRLKDEGKIDEAAAAWQRAADRLAGAIGPDVSPAVAAGARSLNGYVLRGAGRPAEAADAFLAAAKEMQGDRAGDTRWLAVLCLDEAMRLSSQNPARTPSSAGAGTGSGDGSIAARIAANVDGIITDLPETSAAVRARAWRVLHTDVPSTADVDALLSDAVVVELAPAARRAALDGLYRRFRSLSGDERRVAARRALAAGDDVAAGGSEEGTLELRRRLEMAIALDDRMRAADSLAALDARLLTESAAIPGQPTGENASATDSALTLELAARRAQIAALDGRLDDARAALATIPPGSPWGRVAAQSLLGAVLRNPACGPEIRAAVAQAVVSGLETPGITEASMWMRAEAELLRSGKPAVDRAGAERAGALALSSSPKSAALLLASADLRIASGDMPGAAALLRQVLSLSQAGTEPWFEAKAMQIESVASSDPARARALLEQVRQLGSGFGDGAAAARLGELDGRLPKSGAEIPSRATSGETSLSGERR